MEHKGFLDYLATVVLSEVAGSETKKVTVVLPNRRARVFLIEALRQQLTHRMFLPEIISIDELISRFSGLKVMDRVELMFFFYETYLEMTPLDQVQSFEQFSGWATTLLQDFNEIDRYLLEPDQIFSYLSAISEVEHWSVEGPAQTDLISNYLAFWKKLPEYYERLYARLLASGFGYQGMVYREANRQLTELPPSTLTDSLFVFGGFNALNASEEAIVQHLLSLGSARVVWDIDKSLLDDPAHDASLFLRKYRSNWPYYRNRNFDWVSGAFSDPKNIRIIGTPKTIGQARIAGNILEELKAAGTISNGERVAVVLGEENLLLPMLHALPESVAPLNITMGYPARNTPPFLLLSKLFKLHVNARLRDAERYVFYYRDVLEVLNHPMVEPFVKASDCVDAIIDRNHTFLPEQRLLSMAAEPDRLFSLLFSRWEEDPKAVLERLSEVLLLLKEKLSVQTTAEQITLVMVYSAFKLVNQLIGHYQKPHASPSLETLRSIFKEMADLAEISFEGEPLEGLQIMGVLESRLLDFDHVIITSMNEGNFPSGKGGSSFIPYDVKREKGLPTFKEKDAIYSYHFYHLLMRAKNIYLLYNTESEGLDSGEKSRFLTQLEVEKRPAHTISKEIRSAPIPAIASRLIEIAKTESVMTRLRELADVGFSPSALTSYVRNPIDFYHRKILRLREAEEVEESIALNTLGTIIHATLEHLYQPFLNQVLTPDVIADCRLRLDAEILKQFASVYKEGEIRKGRNLLAFEVARRHVGNFLRLELQAIESGDEIIVKALEYSCKRVLEDARLPFPVTIGGNIDRIEIRNGRLRITDYKTGKVEARDMIVSDWTGVAQDSKWEKVIQVLAYAFMYGEMAEGREVEVGIISFKNLKSGFLPFVFMAPDGKQTVVSSEILENYLDVLIGLLGEILDPKVAFVEKI